VIQARLSTDPAACVPFLARALPFYVEGPGDVADLAGAAVFELLDGGRRVGALALEVTTDDTGHHVTVLAAGGEPGHDLLPAIVATAEREARERIRARTVGCMTKRRGLVRRLQAFGYRAEGHNVRKAL
jgi:hypothetical protein